ncbi:Glycerol-3-phosphate acyltransferase 4 [Anabarilius grahami]|uniref:Glycerol-3-phosphate acyltransferase 4 n=1 Tax=Anabarilius grahami TaxID=495550 RepID=A0A3N0XPK8_ANAGA|nr:Glycerol-3-phosphate acyltransferase 4 [Anabarilius grahami]
MWPSNWTTHGALGADVAMLLLNMSHPRTQSQHVCDALEEWGAHGEWLGGYCPTVILWSPRLIRQSSTFLIQKKKLDRGISEGTPPQLRHSGLDRASRAPDNALGCHGNARCQPAARRHTEDEDAVQFANRVKAAIARQGGLVDLLWDGGLKRGKVKDTFKEEQQKIYSNILVGTQADRSRS